MDCLAVVARQRGLVTGAPIFVRLATGLENRLPRLVLNEPEGLFTVGEVFAVGVQDRADFRRAHPVPPRSNGDGPQRAPPFSEQIQQRVDLVMSVLVGGNDERVAKLRDRRRASLVVPDVG